MSAIATGLKLTTSAGVESKADVFRYDDPKFAQAEPTLAHSLVTSYPVSTIDGVSSPLTNISKEGFGTGGYDKNFGVY